MRGGAGDQMCALRASDRIGFFKAWAEGLNKLDKRARATGQALKRHVTGHSASQSKSAIGSRSFNS